MPRPIPSSIAVRILLLIAILAIVARILVPEPTQPKANIVWLEEQGTTMGSTYRLSMACPLDAMNKQLSAELVSEVRKILVEIEKQVSTWNPDSELSGFNAQTTTDWFSVNSNTLNMVSLAQELSNIDRRFDVTVCSLSDLWGLGPQKAARASREPTPADVDNCLQHVGYDKLEVRLDPPGLRKLDPLVRVDLSAIAAGYAADQIAGRLIARGVVDFYLDVAGEIIVGGHNRRGEKWHVGIAEPKAGSQAVQRVLDMTDCSIATSGNYRNFNEIDGRRYGHIINPITGHPTDSDVLSATVIEDSCARADGIATLLMTMPAAEGIALANQQKWHVLLLIGDGDAVREVCSEHMPKR